MSISVTGRSQGALKRSPSLVQSSLVMGPTSDRRRVYSRTINLMGELTVLSASIGSFVKVELPSPYNSAAAGGDVFLRAAGVVAGFGNTSQPET